MSDSSTDEGVYNGNCKLAAIDATMLNFNAENSRDLMQIILRYTHTMYYGHGIMARADPADYLSCINTRRFYFIRSTFV